MCRLSFWSRVVFSSSTTSKGRSCCLLRTDSFRFHSCSSRCYNASNIVEIVNLKLNNAISFSLLIFFPFEKAKDWSSNWRMKSFLHQIVYLRSHLKLLCNNERVILNINETMYIHLEILKECSSTRRRHKICKKYFMQWARHIWSK